MHKRIFSIDKDCFCIYTGLSSADEKSFLRIGQSGSINKTIQSHIGYIVIPDAEKVDYKKEIADIGQMEKGKIRYICNKENREILFAHLKDLGKNESDLFHKDLSKDLDNISRIDNKKHFFTVFYENKNVKIVSDDEIFFELFDDKIIVQDYEEERQRMLAFIETLENLRRANIHKKNMTMIKDKVDLGLYQDKKCSLFLIQDASYIPLNPKMFRVLRITDNKLRMCCNSSMRFVVGHEIRLVLIVDGCEELILKGVIDVGEVVQTEVLYLYSIDLIFSLQSELEKVLSAYNQLLERVI